MAELRAVASALTSALSLLGELSRSVAGTPPETGDSASTDWSEVWTSNVTKLVHAVTRVAAANKLSPAPQPSVAAVTAPRGSSGDADGGSDDNWDESEEDGDFDADSGVSANTAELEASVEPAGALLGFQHLSAAQRTVADQLRRLLVKLQVRRFHPPLGLRAATTSA